MSTIEQPPVTAANLAEYAGRWVAVRRGNVVAAADSLSELRENPEVRRDDVVFVVPASGPYFY